VQDVERYCREIETYLCRKNDGHLIRVVGPTFDLVSGWAATGIPLKIAFRGIDRYFERYYRKGPRRRPVRIDFCEADVLDVFDEWRRALGVVGADGEWWIDRRESTGESRESRVDSHRSRTRASLASHIERVVLRLTQARAKGFLDAEFDDLIDRAARELDAARAAARGARGPARQAIVDRLAALDRELIQKARRSLDDSALKVLAREAEDELAPFRAAMTREAFDRARQSAVDRLIREGAGLPVIAFTQG
jgi:hypothetical protein